jgi:erythromycin esterase
MNHKNIVLIGLILLSSRVASQPQEQSIISWIKHNSHEIKTTSFDVPQKDLLFLEELLKTKKIVSMGEATHGTREFAAIKSRFFKFLALRLNFNVIALEVDFSKALAVNEYILGKRNDGEDALKGLEFFHCVNQETLTLINWMREYNSQASSEKKIKFYGFDFPHVKTSLDRIHEFFTQVDADFAGKLKKIETIKSPHMFTGPYVKKDDIELIEKKLNADSLTYVQNSSQKAWQLTKHLVTLLKYAYIIKYEGETGIRDSLMKKNIDWIINFEGGDTKIMLWAHNAHVEYATWFTSNSDRQFKMMGLRLKETYKEQLYTIGFDFNRGEFYANASVGDKKLKLTLFEIGTAPKDWLAWQFSQAGKELLFTDFANAVGNESVKDWLEQRHKIRMVGALFFEEFKSDPHNYYSPCYLSKSFDGLIFVNNTHGITRLN